MKQLTKKLFGVLTIAMLSLGSVSLFGEDVDETYFYLGARAEDTVRDYKLWHYNIQVKVDGNKVADSRDIEFPSYDIDSGYNDKKNPKTVKVRVVSSGVFWDREVFVFEFDGERIKKVLETGDDDKESEVIDNREYKVELTRVTKPGTWLFGFLGSDYHVALFTLKVRDNPESGASGEGDAAGGDDQGKGNINYFHGATSKVEGFYLLVEGVKGKLFGRDDAVTYGKEVVSDTSRPMFVNVKVMGGIPTQTIGDLNGYDYSVAEIRSVIDGATVSKDIGGTGLKVLAYKEDVYKDGEDFKAIVFSLYDPTNMKDGTSEDDPVGGDDNIGGEGQEDDGLGMSKAVYVYVNQNPKIVTGTGHRVMLKAVEGVTGTAGKQKIEGGEVFEYVGTATGQFIDVEVYFGRKLLDTVSFMADGDSVHSNIAYGVYNDRPVKILIEKEVDSLNNEILIRATELRIREAGEAF